MSISRRIFLSAAGAAPWLRVASQGPPDGPAAVSDAFPAHDPALAQEMVGVAHGNTARVKELLAARPALANASWDWGFGDWESALGAASHTGNREIAALLLQAGARPDIFSAAMLGQIDVVRALVAAWPGIQRTRGPHGITLLSHATAGAAREVTAYLESLGDADVPYTDEPLDDEAKRMLVGTYAFGRAAGQQLIVSNQRGGLAIKREGRVERRLFHLGSRVFHPAGAEKVRIRFAAGTPAPGMSIEDGAGTLTARRVGR
jgi:hypothetical protein